MSAYPYTIKYRDQYNQNMNLITAISFDGGFDQTSTFTAVEGITTDLYNGIKRDHGSRYIEQVELTITLIKQDYTEFTDREKRNVLKWLSSSRYCSWLSLYDENNDPIADVYGRFSHVDEKIADSRVLGFIATFQSPYPYLFSSLRDVSNTFTGSDKIVLENDTDAVDETVKPYMTIQPSEAIEELTILNKSTNRSTVFKNIKANELITIDNENKLVFSNNVYRVIGADMYGIVDGYKTDYPVWFELIDGDNIITWNASNQSAKVEYTFTYRSPMKLGSTF